MAEIDRTFLVARNVQILNLKDFCCLWGKDLIEQIENVIQNESPALVFASFIDHTIDCNLCCSVLNQANKAAKSHST